MMVQHASDFLTRLRQTWRRALSKRRAINELAACPPGELRRIASDVGLSGDDLRQLCLRPQWAVRVIAAATATVGDRSGVCAACGAHDVQRPCACMRVV